MLHRCIEGEKVGVDGSKIVDVDHHHDPCPGGTPAPPGESLLLLLLLLPWPPPRWEESSPSSPWPPWRRKGGSPSKIGSPSLFSSVSRSPDLALHGFLNSQRSVTPIVLKFLRDFFHKISFLCQKKGSNRHSRRTYNRARLSPQARPGGLCALWASVCIYSTSQKSHKFQNNSS